MTRFCWRCAAALDGPPPVLCAGCGQAHYVNPKPCGEAVVVQDGRVLLLRRALEPEAGAWDVPGGFCEADEHPMHAAERELAEESGLIGRATAYVGTWMDVYGEPEADGGWAGPIHTAVSAYLVTLLDPGAQPRLQPEEALEAAWFSLGSLPRQMAFAGHARPMLAAAAALIAGTARPLPDRTW